VQSGIWPRRSYTASLYAESQILLDQRAVDICNMRHAEGGEGVDAVEAEEIRRLRKRLRDVVEERLVTIPRHDEAP
jgi:hypothetical protein